MAYLTEQQLERRHVLPITLPLTTILQGDWLVLATVRLIQGMTLRFKFLQLRLAGIELTSGTEAAVLSDVHSIAFVVAIKNYVVSSDPKALTYVGTAADVLELNALGVTQRDMTADALLLTDPGDYTWLVVNNTANASLLLSVQGQAVIEVP